MKTYINGQFIPQNEAVIPINDRGFKFGDGMFETMRVENGVVFCLKSHILRMENGLKSLKIDADIDLVQDAVNNIININKLKNGIIKIIITRGAGGRGYLPEKNIKPTVIVESYEGFPTLPKEVKLFLSSYTKPDVTSIPQAKTLQGLNSTMARMEADEMGCFDALLLNLKGYICETSSGNIFWEKDNKLYTPSLITGALPGVMREQIIKENPVIEGEFLLDDIKNADRVFITNVVWQKLPVITILPIGYNYQC